MKASENNVLWLHVGSIKFISFLSTDVFMYGSGCCLKFFNMSNSEEHLMIANRQCVNGDGIRAVRGHRSLHVFAYAESSGEAMLYVKQYPSLKTIAAFKDGPPEGYTNMAFSESSLLITLGGIPNYVITIWNWRKNEKLGELTSNIRMEHQILRCNWGAPVSMVQLGKGSDMLFLWDIFTCCKKAVLAKHELKFRDKEFTFAKFNECVWTREGILYVIDLNGCIYSMTKELDLKKEIDVEIEGHIPTSITMYQSGVAVAGPNSEIRHYVKNGSWECDWTITLEVGIKRMFCNRSDFLVGVTVDEKIVEVTKEKVMGIKQNRNQFSDFCLIFPTGECMAALRQHKTLDIYITSDGSEVASIELSGYALALAGSPELPYLAIGYDNGILELISVYEPKKPSVMTSFHLTRNKIEDVNFFEQGRIIVAGCSEIGEFFIIEGLPGTQMKVKIYIHAQCRIADYMLVASTNCYRLFLIPVTCRHLAGNKIIRYCIVDQNNISIKEYYLEHEEFLYHKLFPARTITRDRIFYALPFNSRDIHILETKRGERTIRIISKIKTGHQMRHIGLHLTKYYAVTWGYDGFVFARDSNFEVHVGMALSHHRYYGGVIKARIDPLGKYLISLGRENNLVCTDIAAIEVDEERKKILSDLKNSVKFALMFRRPTLGFKPEGRFENKTWLEVQEILKIEMEEESCRIKKKDILTEFDNIKSELRNLITRNETCPENEKLNIQEFNLDTSLYQARIKLNKEQCKRSEIYLKALIVAQDKVTKYVMENYWNKMEQPGKQLYGIFVQTIVGRYTLLPSNFDQINRLAWIRIQRKLEKYMTTKGSFMPWVILSVEEIKEVIQSAKLLREDYANINIAELMQQLDTRQSKSIESQQAINGAVTSQYIELSTCHYNQAELFTFYQCDLQQSVAEYEVLNLKSQFNQVFDELIMRKQRDMAHIIERNVRLRHIISELNYFCTEKINLEIVDPALKQVEVPEQLTRVMDYELTTTPYVSPSEQVILDAKAAEEERIRLALLADDFKDRALMAMMNGVLEVRWEDELRKEVPVPKCMKEKNPEEFEEEDIRKVKDYEEHVAFLHSERERYKHLLNNEFTRVSSHLRDLIRRFNHKVKDCLEYRMNIDSAGNQENLKVNRMRWKENSRMKLMDDEEEIAREFERTERIIEGLKSTISTLTKDLNVCRVKMTGYKAKDKVLEKAFKKDIREMSMVAQELATKSYKQRPKLDLRKIVSSDVDAELARSVVNQCYESLLLTNDCLDFLRALDQMDQFTGIPPSIDERMHNVICTHRRLKIKMELKIKALQIQITDGENTIGIYQQRLTTNKEKCIRLRAQLEQFRADYQYLIHNTQIQIVLRKGLVEIPLTGSIDDFNDAILIPRKEIEYINQMITEAGNKKIQAIMKNMDFRREIMSKEWEHQKLRMQVNDFIEHLADIEAVRVTKEMQQYLKNKALGRNLEESAESELDRVGKTFQDYVNGKIEKLAKLKRQTQSYKNHNKALDEAIQNVNIDVCDLNLRKDRHLKDEQNEVGKSRLEALLRRTRLVQQIQSNHSEILVLQTELELLRLKTYPTFHYNVIDK